MASQAEKVEMPLTVAGAVDTDADTEASPPLPLRITFTKDCLNLAVQSQPVAEGRCEVIRTSLDQALRLTMADPMTCWRSGLKEDAVLKDVQALAREKFGDLDGAGLRKCRDGLMKAMGWVTVLRDGRANRTRYRGVLVIWTGAHHHRGLPRQA